MQIGQTVQFTRNAETGEILTGTISRIWPKGNLVTIQRPGAIAGSVQTWIRDAANVKPV